ncbi:hypothetical protein SLS62_010137 [Diatrype stigma]|uniref:Amine oxidase n=1 Tax=Diatrype stigma TaxID=117547 RepID=A0AAN9UDP7_9PEZI
MALPTAIKLFLVLSSQVAAVGIPASAADFVIRRDVVILGGGASGAHAAVRLREDYGKSIVIVEKQGNLGGHVETYIDPMTGNPYDYGVNSYTEYGTAKEFFARFNVSISTPVRATLTTRFVDFSTGQELKGYEAPCSDDVPAALRRYLEICEKFEDLMIPSLANFPEINVPEDLLMKFSDFVVKYGLEAMVPRLFQATGMGLGKVDDELTLYVMQAFGAPITRTSLGLAGSFVPTSRRKQDLYDAIAKALDTDVLFSSTVILSHRDDHGVQLLVRGEDGSLTLITAKKLLISFSPTMENMAPFAPDSAELNVFSTWGVNHVYAGIATHPALPDNYSFVNYPTSVVPDNWLMLPQAPFVVRYEYLGDRNFRVLVASDKGMDSIGAQSLAKKTFNTLLQNVISSVNPDGFRQYQDEELEILEWADHTGIHPHVSVEELQTGFYKKLYSLQANS